MITVALSSCQPAASQLHDLKNPFALLRITTEVRAPFA